MLSNFNCSFLPQHVAQTCGGEKEIAGDADDKYKKKQRRRGRKEVTSQAVS
jgi:hypothetical protein